MRNFLFLFATLLIVSSCSPNVAKIDNSLKKHFEAENVDGSFAFFNNQRGDVTVYNIVRDTQRYSPGSMFKIAETLIGIESSRLTDQNTTLTHDTSAQAVTLQKAFDNNDRGFWEALATKIGSDTMQRWLDTVSYGNMRTDSLHSFWYNGQLKISPDEQLGFVYKIYFDKLPFQKYAQEIVRELMLKEDNTLYKFSYTTGTAMSDDQQPMGWIAGWIEENRHVYFFVSLLESKDPEKDLEAAALKITKNILTEKGFFKGER